MLYHWKSSPSQKAIPHGFSIAVVLTAVSLSHTSGCARVVVTRDTSANTVKVALESPFQATSARKPGTAPKTQPQSDSLEQMELALHNRINAQRKKQGLKPLRDNPTLRKVARAYSRRMSEEKFFSHNDPSGKSVAARVGIAGITYRMLGENIAKSLNVRDPLKTAEQGWMNSKGHRENILREGFTETGIGIWKKGRSYHFTQIFLRP